MKRDTLAWSAVGLLAFFFLVGLFNLNDSSLSSDPGPDIDGDDSPDQPADAGGSAMTKATSLDPVQIVAAGIQHVEGWFPGSRSFRNKNPGNIRGVGDTGQSDKDGYAVYSTYEAGFDALLNDLQAKADKHPTFSILNVFERYAPWKDKNNPDTYAAQIASDLSSSLGKPVSVSDNWANLVDQYEDSDEDA